MTLVYGLLLVLVLVGGVAIATAKQKLYTDYYRKTHPPRKEQEEFLEACRLWLEYRKDPEAHPEAAREAAQGAARLIRKGGYLPVGVESLETRKGRGGLQELLKAESQPEHISYEAIERLSREYFLERRSMDEGLGGFYQDSRFWKEGVFDSAAWEAYCAELEGAFEALRERSREAD